jgi:hypothetical protein
MTTINWCIGNVGRSRLLLIALKNSARARLVVPTLILGLTGAAEAQFQYTTNNNTITITGQSGPESDVTIPEQINGLPVTGIASMAFSYAHRPWPSPPLTSIRIPATVTNIAPFGEWSPFAYCTSLTDFHVDSQNPVYSSADGLLFDKTGSTLLLYPLGRTGVCTIPSSVTAIGERAFYKYDQLTELTIPNNVTDIGDSAFYECVRLTSLTIGSGLTSIRPDVFQRCFSLSDITFPDNITGIGERAFAECSGLTNITIGKGVTEIRGGAFYHCDALTNVTISSAVTNIIGTAFLYCQALKSINVHTNSKAYRSLDGVLFDKDQTTLVRWPAGKAATYRVPNGVTKIGPNAFQSCHGLTNITLPQSLADIGDYAFDGSNLSAITIPNNVTNIGECAFQHCELRTLTIPDSVTTIGYAAFSGCSLTKVIMGSSVAHIGALAFVNCYSLKTIFFKGNAPTVGDFVFLHTTGGQIAVTVYYLPGTTGWGQHLSGRIPVLWNPKIEPAHPGFGVGTNGFGFTISGSGNFSVLVEASTNLAQPVWFVVGGKWLTGEPWSFSDPEWTNSTSRFYRIRER